VFRELDTEVARDAGDPDVSWVGYFGYACRRDLPARPGDPADGVPDAVWMRVRDPLVVEHEVSAAEPVAVDPGEVTVPAAPAAAFAAVQEELHAGNSYEVNLTYRERVASPVDPVTAYLRLRTANPAPYAGFLRHRDVALALLHPSRLLRGYALRTEGHAEIAGRSAIRLRGLPTYDARAVYESGGEDEPTVCVGADEVEFMVDVERGVVLRWAGFVAGEEYGATTFIDIAFDEMLDERLFDPTLATP
jgi:hypothetical protein